MMHNENISTVVDYLTASVDKNEVISVEKLTLALNGLENFPMTFEILDSSRVGQILQSIRHSKQITVLLGERIRSLIKCWRQLINIDVLSVIPNHIKTNLMKTPVAQNCLSNGYVTDPKICLTNGSTHELDQAEQLDKEPSTDQSKSPIVEDRTEVSFKENCISEKDVTNRIRHVSSSSKTDENYHCKNLKIEKPKVKSTKELLADFSNFMETDTMDKIMMDKINQDDDEPISYYPSNCKIKELVQLSLAHEDEKKSQCEIIRRNRKRTQSIASIESAESISNTSHCAKLLQQFQQIVPNSTRIILNHIVPWPKIKRGLKLQPPDIKLPNSKQKRKDSEKLTKEPNPPNQMSLGLINNLLERFEVRTQQKEMLSEAIRQRKERTMVIDNTQSLVDMSLKLKLKLPPTGPLMNIRLKKIRKKKKKPKLKLILKPKTIKLRIKKPRQPWIRPMPPITNYLDDIPSLPSLTEFVYTMPDSANDNEVHQTIECSDENVRRLAYGVFEGHNCTKHTQMYHLLPLTNMYSNIINQKYFHVFPWIDVVYRAQSAFPIDSDDLLRSKTEIPDFYL